MTEHERRDGADRPRLDLPRFEFGSPQSGSQGAPFGAPAASSPLGAMPRARVTAQAQAQPQPRATLKPTPFASPAAPAPTGFMRHMPAEQPRPVAAQPTYLQPAAQHFAPAPMARAPQHAFAQPTPPSMHAPQPYMHGAAAPAMPTPQMTVAMPAPAEAVVPAYALAPIHAPMPATAAAADPSINWQRLDQPEEDRTWLQKITPMHMGFLLVAVVVLLIVSSKPGTLKATSNALPGISGGGADLIMPVQPVSTAATTAADAALPPVKMIRIGSGELPVTAEHGGIPSPAASYAMTHASGGGGPVANDGMTLPRTDGQRDAYASEAHNNDDGGAVHGGGGAPADLPSSPLLTPGQSSMNAEQQSAELDGQADNSSPTPTQTDGVS